jgi:hypothetical protein
MCRSGHWPLGRLHNLGEFRNKYKSFEAIYVDYGDINGL